jgi:hypothetical protein
MFFFIALQFYVNIINKPELINFIFLNEATIKQLFENRFKDKRCIFILLDGNYVLRFCKTSSL